jgi:hypothetical protein|eukprot:evm.model.NODE_1278_length_22383_cov_20.731983.3
MFRKTLVLLAAAAACATVSAESTPAAEAAKVLDNIPEASLSVICAPQAVSRNTPFYVNLHYSSPFSRPMAIHVDLLNAETNEWQAGDKVKVTGMKGNVTSRVFVPQEAKAPFKWHAYIAPQDENWPNMLATTTFTADIGAKVVDPCAPLKNTARVSSKPVDFNYVLVKDYPSGFAAGAKAPIKVQYNLMPDQPTTYVSAVLLRSSDDEVVASAAAQAEEGEHTMTMMLDVPAGAAAGEPVYLMAILKPAGKAFSERVAEDRVWSTAVYTTRRLRA